jgi:hypothetical protein
MRGYNAKSCLLYGERSNRPRSSELREKDPAANRDVIHVAENGELLKKLAGYTSTPQDEQEEPWSGRAAVVSLMIYHNLNSYSMKSFAIQGTSTIDGLNGALRPTYNPKTHKYTSEPNAVVDLARKEPVIYLLAYQGDQGKVAAECNLSDPDLDMHLEEHYQIHPPRLQRY